MNHIVRKLAIFVEGQTEQIFVSRLVKEIANRNAIAVVEQKISGKRDRRNITIIKSEEIKDDTEFFVLINDSSGDELVLSDMLRQAESLENSGYSMILGVRDVYPECKSNIDRVDSAISRAIRVGTRDRSININIHLAKMEIEAWFIAEYTHFQRISPLITLEEIKKHRGYDIKDIDYEDIDCPALELNEIRRIGGLAYNKRRNHVSRIVGSLNYEEIYCNTRYKVPRLGAFLDDIDVFLS